LPKFDPVSFPVDDTRLPPTILFSFVVPMSMAFFASALPAMRPPLRNVMPPPIETTLPQTFAW
jgi:hypothetical protein